MIENTQPIFLIAFIAVFFLVIMQLLASISGWKQLAEIYARDVPFEGDRRRFQSLSMGRGWPMMTDMNNVVTLTARPESLTLSTFFPFSMTMKPFTIPLADLSISKRKLMGFWTVTEYRAARAPEIIIRIYGGTARWIFETTRAPGLDPDLAPDQNQ